MADAGPSAGTGLDEDIRRLSSSISIEDSSDEEFELSSGIDKDYESMLLSKIGKLELEIAELQRKLEQKKSENLIETAKNLLHKRAQELSSRCSFTTCNPSHHAHLKKLVKLNEALTGIKFKDYDWDVISRDDTTVHRRYGYDGKAGSISFRIKFEVKQTGEDMVVQNVQVTLNDNASDELKFYIQSLGNDLTSIFGILSQYSMINRQ